MSTQVTDFGDSITGELISSAIFLEFLGVSLSLSLLSECLVSDSALTTTRFLFLGDLSVPASSEDSAEAGSAFTCIRKLLLDISMILCILRKLQINYGYSTIYMSILLMMNAINIDSEKR